MTTVFFVDSDNNVYTTLSSAEASGKRFKTWYYENPSTENLRCTKDEIINAFKSGQCTDKSNNQKY